MSSVPRPAGRPRRPAGRLARTGRAPRGALPRPVRGRACAPARPAGPGPAAARRGAAAAAAAARPPPAAVHRPGGAARRAGPAARAHPGRPGAPVPRRPRRARAAGRRGHASWTSGSQELQRPARPAGRPRLHRTARPASGSPTCCPATGWSWSSTASTVAGDAGDAAVHRPDATPGRPSSPPWYDGAAWTSASRAAGRRPTAGAVAEPSNSGAPPEAEREIVARQLGRPPRALVAVAHRCPCGQPDVVETAPAAGGRHPVPDAVLPDLPAGDRGRQPAGVGRPDAGVAGRAGHRPGARRRVPGARTRPTWPRATPATCCPPAPPPAACPTGSSACTRWPAHALAAGPGVNPIGDRAVAGMGEWWAAGPCARPAEEPRVTRVAAIDCGTNSIRLLVADVPADGPHTDLLRRMEIVRLGQGVDATGRLAPGGDRAHPRGAGRVRRAGPRAGRDRRPHGRHQRHAATRPTGPTSRQMVRGDARPAARRRPRPRGGRAVLPRRDRLPRRRRRRARLPRRRGRRSSWSTSAAARPSSCSATPPACAPPARSTSAACG